MDLIPAVSLLGGLILASGWLLLFAKARFKDDDSGLVEAIDAVLPQTQCAQCGYPGCRPYAEAVAAGAVIDLCPPGGRATFDALQALLGRGEGLAPPAPEPAIARIREAECIGCFLCIRACPVDAIIGAPGFMHTVIEKECTGCELCLPACPVDCIDLVPGAARETPTLPHASADGRAPAQHASQVSGAERTNAAQPCIGCNRCEPVCPVGLAPRELLWLGTAGRLDTAAELGLERCIECRQCDRACPSDIPLARIFGDGKRELAATAARNAQADHAKARFEARTARLAAEQAATRARRAERLARQRRPTGQADSA